MIIVSCSVVVKKDNKVLFIKETKEVAAGKYGLPGGKLELGETLAECAKRECYEETGFEVTVGPLIAITHKPMSREMNSVVRFIFMGQVMDGGMGNEGELEQAWLDEQSFKQLVLEERVRGKDVGDVVDSVFRGKIRELPLPDLY